MSEEKSNLQTWFQWFTDWVRELITKFKDKEERRVLVLERLESSDGLTIAQLVQRNTPGAVSTWYISNKKHPNAHLILALDNIFELKKFLKEPLPDDTVYICRTHLVSVQWLIRVGEKKRQVYKFKGAWLADLQGKTMSINAKAADVLRYVVREVVNLPAIPSISWDSRLDQYLWEDTIASMCKIIDESHKPHLKRVRKPELISS